MTVCLTGTAYAQLLFSYSTNSDDVIARYSRTPGELEAPDSSTTVTIYGDGRVLVHYPPYGKRKGDYQAVLSSAELDQLISNLLSNNVMEYDEQDVSAQKQTILQDSNSGFYMGDADISTIEIALSRYTPQEATARYDVREQISVSALQAEAKKFPSIKALVKLAAAERQFIELINSDELSPLQ